MGRMNNKLKQQREWRVSGTFKAELGCSLPVAMPGLREFIPAFIRAIS